MTKIFDKLSHFLWLSSLLIVFSLIVQLNVNADTTEYYGYVDLNRYDGFSTLSYYVEPIDKSSPPEMVFCLNREFKLPSYLLPQGGSASIYSKIPLTEAKRFADNLQNPLKNIGTNDDILRHEWAASRIMNVIYQAYYNYSDNVLTSSALNELESRIVVQFAIWHFSDDYYPNSSDFEKYKLPSSAVNAYNQLVRTDNRDSEYIEQKLRDKGVTLSLYSPHYVPSDSSGEDRPPQALIGSSRIDSIPPLRFEKRAADDHQLLEGAKFKVVAGGGYIGTEGYPEFEYISSKDNPYIQLSPGRYRIIEEQAPDGYELSSDDSSKVIKVTTDGQITYLNNIDDNGVEHFITLPNNTLTWDNKKKNGNLSLSKKVEGTAGDTAKNFTFLIFLKNGQNQNFSGDIAISGNNQLGSKLTFSDGQASITLKDGEDVTLCNIEGGLHYTVQEVNADDYITTMTLGNQSPQTTKVTQGVIFNNTSISVTNTKEAIPPTGIRVLVSPYLELISCAITLYGIIYIFRRKTK